MLAQCRILKENIIFNFFFKKAAEWWMISSWGLVGHRGLFAFKDEKTEWEWERCKEFRGIVWANGWNKMVTAGEGNDTERELCIYEIMRRSRIDCFTLSFSHLRNASCRRYRFANSQSGKNRCKRRSTSKLKVWVIMGNKWVTDAGEEIRQNSWWAMRKLVGGSERAMEWDRGRAAVLSALAYHRRWSSVKPSAQIPTHYADP